MSRNIRNKTVLNNNFWPKQCVETSEIKLKTLLPKKCWEKREDHFIHWDDMIMTSVPWVHWIKMQCVMSPFRWRGHDIN